MSELNPRNCKFCETPIPANKVFASTVVCTHCGQIDEIKKHKSPKSKWLPALVGLGLVVIAGFLFKDSILISMSSAHAIDLLDNNQLLQAEDKCLRKNDDECLARIYTRLHQNNPEDIGYMANMAFRLTNTGRFPEADKIYKDLLARGIGTYDLMIYYGKNLEGLGHRTEAMKWYEKGLGVKPNLLDITKKLASLYTQDSRPTEAISLLKSFAMRYPDAEGAVAGDISATLELVSETEPGQALRLVGLSDGHFGLPLQLGADQTPEVFLVDTGATTLMIPTMDMDKYWPELKATSRKAKGILADDSVIEIYKFKIPKLKLAGWEFKNIEAAYCDNCVRLAGMSLLKNLKIETESKGALSTLKLRKQH